MTFCRFQLHKAWQKPFSWPELRMWQPPRRSKYRNHTEEDTMPHSPFHSIFHTNTVPSDTECEEIRAFIAEPQRQAAALTVEITQVQRTLDDLMQKMDALTSFIDPHLALCSPARRLSDDIVRGILIACLPTTHNAVVSPAAAPLLLCHICSSWRALALSTPQLWATLHIVVPSVDSLKPLADVATTWLSRSGALPLSISVVANASFMYEPGAANANMTSFLASLCPFASRWKNIRVVPPNVASFERLADIVAEDVPLLETISFHPGCPTDPHVSAPWESLSLLTAPSIRNLSISGGSTLIGLPIAYASLTELTIGRPDHPWGISTSHDAVALSRQCSALERCKLFLKGPHVVAEDVMVAPVHLPHLSYLALEDGTWTNTIHDLFVLILFPNLRSLSYRSSRSYRTPLPSMFVQSLERLQIDTDVPSSDLLQFLQLLPVLRELHIIGEPVVVVDDEVTPNYGDAAFLSHFIPGVLCPNLSILKLDNFYSVSDEGLVDLIRARASPHLESVARLSRFTASLNRNPTLDVFSTVQPLIDAGLQLTLEYTPYWVPAHSPWDSVTDGSDQMF
ncbi:hypothetical protein C8R43DRAFT_955703 [Mycena crocata]|nr:hypothetical protein C8R43DRAFT_955703 [Mycena crocata]